MAGDDQLADGEERVLLLHPHWKMLLRPCLLLVVVAAAALALLLVIPAGRYSGPARAAVGLAAAVALITWCAVPYLRWRTTTYELTTQRLRLRSGIVSRSGRDFPLTRISDVSSARGPADRLLGCGRLVVESPGEHGQLVLAGIPRVALVQSTLFQLAGSEQARLAADDRP